MVSERGSYIMKTNRRNFISTALAGGIAAGLTLPSGGCETKDSGSEPQKPDYAQLDEILLHYVLRK